MIISFLQIYNIMNLLINNKPDESFLFVVDISSIQRHSSKIYKWILIILITILIISLGISLAIIKTFKSILTYCPFGVRQRFLHLRAIRLHWYNFRLKRPSPASFWIVHRSIGCANQRVALRLAVRWTFAINQCGQTRLILSLVLRLTNRVWLHRSLLFQFEVAWI